MVHITGKHIGKLAIFIEVLIEKIIGAYGNTHYSWIPSGYLT